MPSLIHNKAMKTIEDLQRHVIEIQQKLTEQSPTIIGVALMKHYQERFRTSSWEGKGWPLRKSGADGRALLIKSSHLVRGFGFAPSPDRVYVYNELPYAKAHNEGETIKQTPTPKQRGYFWARYSELHAPYKKNNIPYDDIPLNVRNEMGMWKGLALANILTIHMPKRQFMDIPGQELAPASKEAITKELKTQFDNLMPK
jgi:hypothetical protein